MVVRNLNIRGMTSIPLEADPPLAIDADAVLALTIALQDTPQSHNTHQDSSPDTAGDSRRCSKITAEL
jgi:hypothetical protein